MAYSGAISGDRRCYSGLTPEHPPLRGSHTSPQGKPKKRRKFHWAFVTAAMAGGLGTLDSTGLLQGHVLSRKGHPWRLGSMFDAPTRASQ